MSTRTYFIINEYHILSANLCTWVPIYDVTPVDISFWQVCNTLISVFHAMVVEIAWIYSIRKKIQREFSHPSSIWIQRCLDRPGVLLKKRFPCYINAKRFKNTVQNLFFQPRKILLIFITITGEIIQRYTKNSRD